MHALPARRPVGLGVMPLLVFFAIGLLETLLAYFAFSRADDHAYFLELANVGLRAVPDGVEGLNDLKGKMAGAVFFLLTTPSRWLGGHELVHLLWLRFITLFGFVSGFKWIQATVAPEAPRAAVLANFRLFALLVLLYPGQLAWTASLLRDGAGTALFLIGLNWLRPSWRLPVAALLFGASFSLRPEYVLIFILLFFPLSKAIVARLKSPLRFLILVLAVFSVVTHPVQVTTATFGHFAFGDDGPAYPLVTGAFDVAGYLRVVAQAVLDPVALSNPLGGGAFGTAEMVFFVWLLWRARTLLVPGRPVVATMAMALITGLWIFAYFEIFVSGFSRHRLCLEIALIALVAAARQRKTA